MKKLFGLVFALALVFGLMFTSGGNTVNAQEEDRTYWGIIISPSIFHLTIPRGTQYSGSLELTNDFEHGETVLYSPAVANFTQNGESGNPALLFDDNLPYAADSSKWITHGEVDYSIPYGERVISNFTVSVPEDAEPGGHYSVLLYSDRPPGETEEEAISLENSIGALLFITVPGDVVEEGELVDFATESLVTEFLPTTFSIRYKNTGNVHTQVGGNIYITRGSSMEQLAVLKVNEDVGYTLPGSTRNYTETWNGGWIRFDESGKLKIDKEEMPKLYWGKYTAMLRLKHTVGGERITTEDTITFWIIPWRILLAILGVVVLVIIIVLSRKSIKRRNSSKNPVQT